MNEFTYDTNSALIAALLFISMALAMEAGYRMGFNRKNAFDDNRKSHVNAMQGSMLGILALLLGFTFSMALQRYDSRSEAVVGEANAIGTAWLRTSLLAPAVREDTRRQLRDYLDLRIQASTLPENDPALRSVIADKTAVAHAALWKLATRSVEVDPVAVTSGLYVQALNDVIDHAGKRDAELKRHVPELVLLLLYGTFLTAGGLVGFSTGVAGHRPSLVAHLLVLLIVVLVFIIIDLDRPRRGLIKVNQGSLIELQASIKAETTADAPR